MPKYEVTVSVQNFRSVKVSARDEAEAIEKASHAMIARYGHETYGGFRVEKLGDPTE